jgi:DNA-binding NarL/FixJ family response regulator
LTKLDEICGKGLLDTMSLGKILIVDDEAMLVESLTQAALAEGYEAESAPDGELAWEKLQSSRFDLVATDLRMPKVDGPTLMSRISELTPSPMLIVMTGYASLEAAVDCLRKGAADFLEKPFEVEDFLEAVRKVMGRAGKSVFYEPDWDKVCTQHNLTKRQCEVLRALFLTGKSNRELADDLFLSTNTVKSHLQAAFDKLGVSSRGQLLRKLRELPATGPTS